METEKQGHLHFPFAPGQALWPCMFLSQCSASREEQAPLHPGSRQVFTVQKGCYESSVSQEPLGRNSSQRLSEGSGWPSPRWGWGYNLLFVNLLGPEPEQFSQETISCIPIEVRDWAFSR